MSKADPTKPAEKAPVRQVGAGDIVLVRVGGTEETPELRPAIVLRKHSDHCVNALVLCEPSDDEQCPHLPSEQGRGALGHRWVTSVTGGNEVGQWRHRAAGGE